MLSSCSWGGNGMRHVHREATEHVGANRLGWNRRWKRGLAYRRMEETDLLCSEQGPVDREGCGVPQNGGNGPPTVETRVLLIGRGVAYRKTDEPDLLRSKRGSCSLGGVWRTTKRDSTRYCSSPPSTSSSLHGLLFIQPPRAPVHPASTARYSMIRP